MTNSWQNLGILKLTNASKQKFSPPTHSNQSVIEELLKSCTQAWAESPALSVSIRPVGWGVPQAHRDTESSVNRAIAYKILRFPDGYFSGYALKRRK